MIRISRVFPDPFDPAIIKHCPSVMSKLMSSRAVKIPSPEEAGNVLVIFLMEKRDWGLGTEECCS
jgi:hypothetical protein